MSKKINYAIVLILLAFGLISCGGEGYSAVTSSTNVSTATPLIISTVTATAVPTTGYANTGGGTGTSTTISGTVTSIFDSSPMSGLTVAINSKTVTTDTNGNYSISATGSTARMTVTGSSIWTRSFMVDLSNGTQDVTVCPVTYNLTMFKALITWSTSTSTTLRWQEKPTFVIYSKVWDTGATLNTNYITQIKSIILNELPSMTNNVFSSCTIEVLDEKPSADSRWTTDSSTTYWGYIADGSHIGIAVRQTLDTSGSVLGIGGPVYDNNNYIIGGGAVIKLSELNSGNIDTVRHEIGHTLGLAHPFESLNYTSSSMENSVMNYIYTGKHSTTYSDADIKALTRIYHRAPGNSATTSNPDKDPDDYYGYQKIDLTNVHVICAPCIIRKGSLCKFFK